MSDNEQEQMWEDHHGDDSPIMSGWSITVGELKRALLDVPDDYEVMLENADVDDCDISNVNINRLYPPALGSPGLLVLGGGQIVNSEYAYHERMDAHHTVGGDKWWSSLRGDKEPKWETHD